MIFDPFKQSIYDFILKKYSDLRETMYDFAHEFDQEYPDIVISSGIFPNNIFIVGRDLGKEEVIQHKPFVGKSGKILRNVLKFVGFNDEKIFFTNVVPFKPKNNVVFSEKIRKEFSVILKFMVQISKPKYIFTCGLEATEVFTDKIQGSFLKYCKQNLLIYKNINVIGGYHSFYIIPIPHPSYFVRKGFTENISSHIEDNEFNELFINKFKYIFDTINSHKEDFMKDLYTETNKQINVNENNRKVSKIEQSLNYSFKYNKGNIVEEKSIILLDEDDNYLFGIDTQKLLNEHYNIYSNFNNMLKNNVLKYAFRKYKKNKII